ncbi:hypothetical protein SLE2022_183360 [Rubroshorea leprosula]
MSGSVTEEEGIRQVFSGRYGGGEGREDGRQSQNANNLLDFVEAINIDGRRLLTGIGAPGGVFVCGQD